MVCGREWHHDMMEFLVPYHANESGDPLLQRSCQADKNRWAVSRRPPVPPLAFEHEQLCMGKRKQFSDEAGSTALE